MLRRLSTSLLAVVALVAFASNMCHAQAQALLTHHLPEVMRNGQAPLVGHLPATQTLDITLVLQHRDQAGLESFLKDVYDPSSPNYRQFLTVDEFTYKFGPSAADYETVKDFVKASGLEVVNTSRNRMIVQVRGSVANIEKALNVSMNLYHDPAADRIFFSPDREPSVNLPFQLWHVNGLDNYSVPKPMLTKRNAGSAAKSNATTGSGPSASFLGSDMRAAYYIDGNSSATLTGAGQSLGLFELIGTDLTDLDTYYTNVGQTNNVPITLKSVDTQSTSCLEKSGCDDTEQTIDMTQALGMAPGLSSLVMYIGTGALSGQTVDDVGILNAMATSSPLNSVLSCSWAWKPTDNTTDDPIFEEFAAQGQNFFAAAGDDGKWTATGFAWPADDPNIVSVGGTDLDTASAAGPWASETGWSDTGGGISPNKFAIPSWQVAAAATCSKCSQTYRNGPDVSANANFSFYVCADQTTCTANDYGGTSFATPMWAAYIALANEQYLLNGSTSTLGFINPALYAIGLGSSYDTDFHDITSGGNSYGSTVGYDLSTGWGSPNGSALITALVGAPSAGFSLSASPNAVSVAQGASGTSTITSTVTGGFDSSIALSASGQPTGVTVGFTPTSITGAGTSTMNITVGSTVTAGTYTITVSGISGSTTETTTVTLTVTATTKGSFTVKASPTTLSIAPGGTGSSKVVTTVSGGFDAAIALTASGEGTGVNVKFNPATIAAPGSGHSVMEVKVAPSAKTGTRTITITGTGNGVTETTKVTLTIN